MGKSFVHELIAALLIDNFQMTVLAIFWFFPNKLVIGVMITSTRVVQKLIETLKTRQQISLVKAALKPGFLDLIKDLNGNHVLQRCLQCLSNEDNEV